MLDAANEWTRCAKGCRGLQLVVFAPLLTIQVIAACVHVVWRRTVIELILWGDIWLPIAVCAWITWPLISHAVHRIWSAHTHLRDQVEHDARRAHLNELFADRLPAGVRALVVAYDEPPLREIVLSIRKLD